MPTLGDVWHGVFPAARPEPGTEDAHGRSVGWVRVLKARVPAFDALDVEDLAIVPEQALRGLVASGLDAAMVVDAVAAARGAAIVLIPDDVSGEEGRSALERAGALRLPAFVLPDADPTVLERSVIGYIVNARAEVDRRAARLEAELERLALSGADLAAQAAAIATFLGRAVAIEGPRGEALAVHAPPGSEAAAAAAAGYLARRQRVALRTPLPAPTEPTSPVRRGRRSAAGTLAILGPDAATELERTASDRVAGLLALELDRAALRGTGQRERDELPSDGPPWVVLMARQVTPEAPEPLEEREALRATIRRLAPRRQLALRGDATSLELRLVAAVPPADPAGTDLAERVAAAGGRLVAVSRPFTHPDDRGMAEAEARATLEVTGSAEASGPVARADRLPAYRLLASLPVLPDGLRHARALLAPILTGRPQADRARLATVRAIVDHPGLADAAGALGVHRNTLAYRLRRIEKVTGWRLDDPSLRFALSLAVRIVQKAQHQAVTSPGAGSPDEATPA